MESLKITFIFLNYISNYPTDLLKISLGSLLPFVPSEDHLEWPRDPFRVSTLTTLAATSFSAP